MKQVHKDVGLGLLCELFGKTRQAYYKRENYQERKAIESGIVLDLVAKVREKIPRIGSRKLHHMLSNDFTSHGIKLGRDALFDLLEANNMLIRPRKRHTRTTNSRHHFRKYKNLLNGFTAQYINELWFSDITYIMVEGKWCYVIFITDAYSHKVVGYHVDDNMSAEFCEVALDQALEQWKNSEQSLIHHSDRGVQYCSNLYTEKLKEANIKISMTQNGDPRENAVAERVNGIFKGDFLMDQHFENLAQARNRIAEMVYNYNHFRPHESCDYLTPQEAYEMTGPLKKRWKPKKYGVPFI